jgi:hypothetical protein
MNKLLKKYTPSGIKHAVRVMRGKNFAGRALTVRDTDVFIVSYPKSGNTWTRFIIGNLIYEDGVDFANIEHRVPDIYHHSDSALNRLPSPRVLKSHECFDSRYKKVIYIVRDPRDVVISYMHYAKKSRWISDQMELDEFVGIFLGGGFGGYGTWGENVGSWLGARGNSKDFLLLRYEDMLKDTESALWKISLFLGLSPSAERIKRAIESSSFEHMKNLESKQSGAWSAIRESRRDIPFVRAGKSGEWKAQLSDTAAKLIKERWIDTIERVGYAP